MSRNVLQQEFCYPKDTVPKRKNTLFTDARVAMKVAGHEYFSISNNTVWVDLSQIIFQSINQSINIKDKTK